MILAITTKVLLGELSREAKTGFLLQSHQNRVRHACVLFPSFNMCSRAFDELSTQFLLLQHCQLVLFH